MWGSDRVTATLQNTNTEGEGESREPADLDEMWSHQRVSKGGAEPSDSAQGTLRHKWPCSQETLLLEAVVQRIDLTLSRGQGRLVPVRDRPAISHASHERMGLDHRY